MSSGQRCKAERLTGAILYLEKPIFSVSSILFIYLIIIINGVFPWFLTLFGANSVNSVKAEPLARCTVCKGLCRLLHGLTLFGAKRIVFAYQAPLRHQMLCHRALGIGTMAQLGTKRPPPLGVCEAIGTMLPCSYPRMPPKRTRIAVAALAAMGCHHPTCLMLRAFLRRFGAFWRVLGALPYDAPSAKGQGTGC